ncbi:MAG: hybrid sensor histidine kinase/response regulator, partial [Desulfovibrionaceae bacterium]
PLNGIMGMLQLVRTTSLSEAQCEYVDTALEASRHLLSLLNDVLDYAAVESGRLPLQCVEFSPEALLSSMAAIYREQCRAKGLDFRFLYDPAIPPKILGDPGRVRQIIFNLVGNAIKFTHRGCVTLDASLLHCDTPGRCRLLFSIGDTGIGIPEEKIAHVFDDFTQVDGSISRHYQGTGLGLALVKRLVQLLGGTIALDSEPGAGTTFMFCVQLGLPKPVPAGRPERQSATPRVLVAEDNPSTQFALRDLLDSLGCESVMVPNGREALMALSEEPFACVLMDVQMPEMDGLEATRFIRAAAVERIDPEVPIIGLLAPSVGTGCDSFIKAGMNDCLVKPLERNVLAEALAPFLIR